MADEEHAETGEYTAREANSVAAEDDPRADPGPSAVQDGYGETIVTEDEGEEEQEQEEQADVTEDVPPETVNEPKPDAVVADESRYVPPEPESAVLSPEEVGKLEDKGGDEEEEEHEEQAAVPEDLPIETVDELPQQLIDSTGEEVTAPAVTDDLVAVEEAPVEPQEIVASLTEDDPLQVSDDGYKDTVVSQLSDIMDVGMETNELDDHEDRPQSAEQLADEPDDVVPYPSVDKIDILETADEVDKLAVVDEGDQPDPTRATERVGMVQECPEVPVPPSLLVDGRDDIESPKGEPVVPTVLSMMWSFGINKNIPVINLTSENYNSVFYVSSNVGVIYDYVENKQLLLQGHSNAITCTCSSYYRRWVVTADIGPNSMVIVWDSRTGVPVKTIFDCDIEGGCRAVALSQDARYLATLSAAEQQMLAIWDWTSESEVPLCTATLLVNGPQQTYITFNPDNVAQLVSNSETQAVFYGWFGGKLEYYAPPLTDEDFNKPVGKFSQTIFLRNSSRALTATSIGNMIVWDANKFVTLAEGETTQDKKALKIVRMQERAITVLTVTDDFIVTGDVLGHVKFFDQELKLLHWYHDFQLGPVNSLSFAFVEEFNYSGTKGGKYPHDSTIKARTFVVRDFVIGTSSALVATVRVEGTDVKVILREHDDVVPAVAVHPSEPIIAVASYCGMIKLWQYRKRKVITSRVFEKGLRLSCCTYDAKGQFIAIGFLNGMVRLVDSLSLEDCVAQPFNNTNREAITLMAFSHNCEYFATADAAFTVTVYIHKCMRKTTTTIDPYVYLGRYRAHYKPIRHLMFGLKLNSDFPRLLTLGEDRMLVEYDLEVSRPNEIQLLSSDRIEQSAVPLGMTWYPPITKESFILTVNNQYKFKLYNSTTKMCRQTYLSPTYGSPLQKLLMLPATGAEDGQRFMAFMLEDKIGVIKLPLTGNPHLASALIVHPQGVSDIACSHDGKYLFSVGGQDLTVNMWRINTPVLDAQEKLGGDGLEPFFGLLDGGRNGNLFREMEDYFYYAQIRSQGMEVMEMRHVSEKIPLSEVPFIMRALGYYPTEQEIEEILNEVKFSRYVETGECRTDIDLPDFIRLFVNHKPAFGLQPELIRWAFDVLGGSVDRGELLHLLQTRGEKMTEDELAEHLTTLLGVSMEGASSATLGPLDEDSTKDLLETQLPETIDADVFIHKIVGFSARRPDGTGAANGDTGVDPRPTSNEIVAHQA